MARKWRKRDDRAGGAAGQPLGLGPARLSVAAVHTAGGPGRPHCGHWATSEVQDKGGISVDVVGTQAETMWH